MAIFTPEPNRRRSGEDDTGSGRGEEHGPAPGWRRLPQPRPAPFYRSADRGRSWIPVPVEMPHLPHPQVLHGIGISADGRLWLSHGSDQEYPGGLYGQDLYVSHSGESLNISLSVNAINCP